MQLEFKLSCVSWRNASCCDVALRGDTQCNCGGHANQLEFKLSCVSWRNVSCCGGALLVEIQHCAGTRSATVII